MISLYEIKQMMNEKLNKKNNVAMISKKSLHEKLGLHLTDTWMESNKLNEYYNPREIKEEIRNFIVKSEWIK